MASSILNTPKVDIYRRLFQLGDFDFITVKDGLKHEKQELALKCLTDKQYKEVGYGGAAGGAKSWTGCSWLAFMCLNYPGTRWYIAREELKRLRESTLITWFKVCSRYDIKKDVYWKYNGQDHYIEFTNGSRIDLLEVKELPSDPLFERYGSIEYTGGFFEELSEISFMAYDTLKSRCGRQLNDKYDLVPTVYGSFNPKKNFVYKYFYKRDKEKTLPKHIIFIKALLYDNPHRESAYEQQLKDLSNKAQRERLLGGNFEYDDDPTVLVNYENILSLYTNRHILNKNESGAIISTKTHDSKTYKDKYITCDVARLGDDKTVIWVWHGLNAFHLVVLEKKTTDEVAKVIKELQNRFNVPMSNTIIDADGIGGGVVDQLKGCVSFVNNSAPFNKENFSNLKSQCYFKLADLMNSKDVLISVRGEWEESLSEEIEMIKEKDPDSDGKKSVISKEDVKKILGRSPDYSDALMLRTYPICKGPGGGAFNYQFA